MTAKDAFAIAFDDEVVALDAMPGNDMPRNKLPNKPNAPSGLKKNAAAAPGVKASSLGSSGTGDASLAEHMARYHPNGFDPQTDHCKLFDSIVGNMEQQGIGHEEAVKRAMLMHNAGAIKSRQGQEQGGEEKGDKQENLQGSQETGRAPIDAQAQEAKINQMVDDPSLIISNESQMLANGPETIQTPEGEKTVQTDTEKAAVTVLAQTMNEGGDAGLDAEKALNQLPDSSASTEPQAPEGVTPNETAELQPKTFESKLHPDIAIEIDDETASILEQDPNKAELLDRIIDARIKKAGTSSDAERRDLDNDIDTLQTMFYGEEGHSVNEEPNKEQPASEEPTTPEPRKEEVEEEKGKEEQAATPKEEAAAQEPQEPEAPPDMQFETKKPGVYKVGDTHYRDVSNMGLLHSMIASFMAGLHGQQIITGWDRISGKWDEIKRSKAGNNLRSGIAASLLGNEISKYSSDPKVSSEANAALAIIQDMANQAKTPAQQMAAFKQFAKWKKEYAQELGELESPDAATAKFSPLSNDYKGTTPPLSILKKPKGFKADEEFGEYVANALKERLGILGTPVEEVESIKVGPSATTIEFKVSPVFDLNRAKSKASKESLKGATGASVTNMEYTAGKTDVVSVTVSNAEMRDVSFADSMHSKEWKKFSEKATLPIPLGKDASGKDLFLDIAKQPHMLVTGASGSGKSIFFASAINGLEMAKTPDQARIVLLDPKDEFKAQDGSPHLLYPRAKESKDVASVVSNLRSLMEERISKIGGTNKAFDPTKNEYQGDSEHNIAEYNAAHPGEKPMESVMVVFDEFAKISKDPTYGPQVIADVSQILALGRSVGINMIIGTQRSDVKSIPGELQANTPCHLAFKASKDDAKAPQEVKDLAGSGDFILSSKEGTDVRGRGCFITNEEISAVPKFYRDNMEGKYTLPTDGGSATEATLPKEYTDGIEEAIKNKQPISVQAIEGLEEAFKNSLPKGWTIENEKVDGDNHWKATPPKPTRVDSKDAKKKEADPADEDFDMESRQSIIEHANKIRKDKEAKAKEAFKKHKDLDKFNAEMDEIEAEQEKWTALADRLHPEPQDGGEGVKEDGGTSTPTATTTSSTTPENEEEEEPKYESPFARANKPENRIAAARKHYDEASKALEKRVGKDGFTYAQYLAELKKLDDDYNDYEAQVKAGKTDEEIEAAYEKARQEKEAAEAADLEKKRSLVTTVKGNKKVAGATHILESGRGRAENIVPIPKKILEKASKNLPKGFEIDSDNDGKPLMIRDKYGYARHPNGSYGRITPDGKFHLWVDTTSPHILGEDHPKTIAAKKKWMAAEPGSQKEKEAEKDYNLKAFGVEVRDEFPEEANNTELVAMAVAKALALNDVVAEG